MTSVNVAELRWRKSSRSSTWSNCVEVASVDQAVMTRDSKHPEGAVLAFAQVEWTSFLEAIRTDRFQG